MDEVEWWEFDSPKELAEQAAGDIAFVIESAIEAHGNARLALAGGPRRDHIHEALVARDLDWSKVTLVPTDDRLVGHDDETSMVRQLRRWFDPVGAEVVPLIDESALGDYREAGRLADDVGVDRFDDVVDAAAEDDDPDLKAQVIDAFAACDALDPLLERS